MAAILPVPSGRLSDLLVQGRLLAQLQVNQLDLLRLESQLSTGRRISKPSEDAPAALSAVALQRLLEQKTQIQANLNAGKSYLAATDTALSDASQLLMDVRAVAVGAVQVTGDDSLRQAAEEVRRAVQQLTDIGNQQFRNRYLLTGSRTAVRPFEMVGQFVAYYGNDAALHSYADINLLLEGNVSGDEAFGAISSGAQSTVDWNPILTPLTRLADLNGGRGVTSGALVISDGSSSRTIDLSSAETLGDVVRLIEASPPEGRQVTVRIAADHLEVSLDASGGGNLTIREVGNGIVAADLGILESSGTGADPIIGQDINPRLRLTTRLTDILGVRSSAVVASSGPDNDIVLEARERGQANNGVRIQFVDDSLLQAAPGLHAGDETATYSDTAVSARAALTLSGPNNNLVLTANTPGAALNNIRIEIVDAGAIGNAAVVAFDADNQLLTIGVDTADATQVQTVINAINSEGTFAAAYDASDPGDGGFLPTAVVQAADAGVVSGNTGNSGGEPRTIFIRVEAGVSTANQVVAALQADAVISAMFQATLDEKDSAAVDPGEHPIDIDAFAVTEGGAGVEFDQTSGLQIVHGNDTYTVDFQGAETVEDLLNVLNGRDPYLLAEINESATGINVRSRLSGADLRIGENGGDTATQLGIRTFTRDTRLDDLNYGLGVQTAAAVDFLIRRNDGVELDIDISSARTIGDVIDLINNHPANLDPLTCVTARLVDVGNGIELVDDNPAAGGQLRVIRQFGSYAAWDLGLIPSGEDEAGPSAATASAASASVAFDPPNDQNTALLFTAVQPGSAMNDVDIEFQDTLVGDVASVLFDAVGRRLVISIDASQTTANTVAAAVAAEGTFQAVLDTSSDPTNDGTGVVGAIGVVASTSGGGPDRHVSDDVNPLETKGVFNSLLRLHAALSDFNLPQIERAVEMLDDDFSRLNFCRAELGARQQGLEVMQQRIEDEDVELRSSLSLAIDADLAKVISDLSARQAAFEASLRLIGQTMQLSLLDFI